MNILWSKWCIIWRLRLIHILLKESRGIAHMFETLTNLFYLLHRIHLFPDTITILIDNRFPDYFPIRSVFYPLKKTIFGDYSTNSDYSTVLLRKRWYNCFRNPFPIKCTSFCGISIHFGFEVIKNDYIRSGIIFY